MVRADNRYSRFVGLAKVAFPLVALALLSTLFLFSRDLDPSQAIPFADVDVEKLARDQRLAAPKFSGVTANGSEVFMEAQSALPDPENPRRMTAQTVMANVQTPDGLIFDVTAEKADYDGTSDRLVLIDTVEIETSTGYAFQSDELITNIRTGTVESPGPIAGSGPEGTISAGSMSLASSEAGQVLVFKGDVKLIYRPKGQR